MNNYLSLPLEYLDNQERLKSHPVKRMEYQQLVYYLVQTINQIIANNSVTALMLPEIAKLLGVTFNVDCCCLTAVTGEAVGNTTAAHWLSDQYAMQQPGEMFSPQQVMMDLPLVECAGEPLSMEDISTIQNSLMVGSPYLPLPIKAILAIPTRLGGKNNGVICLLKFQTYHWQESEKELLKHIEPSCAIAFSQVLQAQVNARQNQELQKTYHYQNLIKQLTLLSRSKLELNQMLESAIASTAESLEVDRGLLVLLKYTDPLLRVQPKTQIPQAKATVVAEWNRCSPTIKPDADQTFSLTECSLSQRVFTESGSPVIIDDYQEFGQVTPLFTIQALPHVLLMSLENQGKVLGFVVLQQAQPRQWQGAELNLVEMVCAQMSNTIIESQTLRQVQTVVDERTAKLKSSLELQAKLHERTRRYVEQLRELNELKDEFLSNISDRLRYPLTNMLMSIKNLRLPGISQERQHRYLDILEQECSQEINLINDLLTLQKLESDQQPLQCQTIDLNGKIQELSTAFQGRLGDKSLTMTVDVPKKPLILQTEPESFDRILQELLNNAYTYSEHNTVIRLLCFEQLEAEVNQVIIKVINTGRAISPEEATYIFDKFRRGKGRWHPGTGLGLALVKSLVQHLNGAIAVESMQISDSPLSDICFTLTLPQHESKAHSQSD